MANTPNFNLYKPSRTDTTVEVDVSLADNFTKIDTEIKVNKDGLAGHISNPNAHTSENISHADGSVKTTLENHEERLTSGEVAQADHETRISSNETAVADHGTRLTDVELKATDIDTRVTDIEVLGIDKLAPNLEGRITTLEGDVEGFLAPATFDAMDNQSYTFDEYRIGYVDNKLAPIESSLAEIATNINKYPRLGGETDDTQRFIRAISFLSSSVGGTLLIPSGTYSLNSLVIDGIHNLTILNYGTLKASGTVTKFIEVKNCNDFKLINGSIDANNFATYGVSLLNSPRFLIDNVYVKSVGSDALASSAYGIGVGYSCNYGVIRNTRVNYVHSSTVASGIGLGLQSTAVTDYELMSKHCTVDNVTVEDISPQADADGLKILSEGIIDCDLVVKNSRFINCRKRGLKFQAAGCKSENNYIEFTVPFASAGIDFQRGFGSSNNDTVVFTGNPSSVLDGGGNVIDGNGLVYAPVLISVGDVRVSGLKYRVKNDYSMLIGKLPASSLVRFTWLVESGVPSNTPIKNVILEDISAQAISRLITFQIPVDNLTFINNTVELMYSTMLTGAFTVTNFKMRGNQFSYLDTSTLIFNSGSTVISSGDIDIQDPTAKMFFNIRTNDLRVKFNRMGDNLNSRNFEQRQGMRTHFMTSIPSAFPNDNGLQFNSCAIGDICLNTNKQPLSDGGGNYVIDKWECTAVADATFTRGQWRAYKQYY